MREQAAAAEEILRRRSTEAARQAAEAAEHPLPEDWREKFGLVDYTRRREGRIELNGAFDFRNPDYQTVFSKRAEALARIRAQPVGIWSALKSHYRNSIPEFISDWGCTFDPRNVEVDLPSLIPFILYPRQIEWVEYTIDHWRRGRPGLTEKSRDMGVSWLSVATADSLCIFFTGLVIGFGSRDEDYVDKLDDPKSLFSKAQAFIENLPEEFRAGWTRRNRANMRINFPETGAVITGEGGDNIGRGNRTSLYIVDEAAHLRRPLQVEASLSQTTNCRLDVSTPNRPGDWFQQRRFSGKVEVFTFHWKSDPRKDEAWYEQQCADLDPVTVAREIDIDYSASVERIVIPHRWVMSAIDAHLKLGLAPSGSKHGALDVADEGVDTNAFCAAYGFRIEALEEWSGKGADIMATTERAFQICDEHELTEFRYDSDGLGAGVRGDARVINARRKTNLERQISVVGFRGSEAVVGPDHEDVRGRKNKDFFANRKAQGWWALRRRFEVTHRWIAEGVKASPDQIISIPSRLELHMKLAAELAQPTYSTNAVGKILIDKQPDGTKSPNLGDAVMIRFARAQAGFVIPAGAVAAMQQPNQRAF